MNADDVFRGLSCVPNTREIKDCKTFTHIHKNKLPVALKDMKLYPPIYNSYPSISTSISVPIILTY